ncbi:hypothetical protein [Methylobacterium sp. Leaf118]|uniref:hypothetical protein n=1 Tax=Methylobacterium sp. Leaf118 TaxID=2876562 RepID=UPI001E341E69|nr:hypothetical protein [Methylobacterium sp. Leaf118]
MLLRYGFTNGQNSSFRIGNRTFTTDGKRRFSSRNLQGPIHPRVYGSHEAGRVFLKANRDEGTPNSFCPASVTAYDP